VFYAVLYIFLSVIYYYGVPLVCLFDCNVFVLARLCRALCSAVVRLCLGVVYPSVYGDVSVSCMYLVNVSLECCGKCNVYSVSLLANIWRSRFMSVFLGGLGVGMKVRPLSSTDVSGLLSV